MVDTNRAEDEKSVSVIQFDAKQSRTILLAGHQSKGSSQPHYLRIQSGISSITSPITPVICSLRIEIRLQQGHDALIQTVRGVTTYGHWSEDWLTHDQN